MEARYFLNAFTGGAWVVGGIVMLAAAAKGALYLETPYAMLAGVTVGFHGWLLVSNAFLFLDVKQK